MFYSRGIFIGPYVIPADNLTVEKVKIDRSDPPAFHLAFLIKSLKSVKGDTKTF